MCNLLAEAEEAVVEGVASSYSLLTQREPQHQVMLHVVQLSVAHTDPVGMSRVSESAQAVKCHSETGTCLRSQPRVLPGAR